MLAQLVFVRRLIDAVAEVVQADLERNARGVAAGRRSRRRRHHDGAQARLEEPTNTSSSGAQEPVAARPSLSVVSCLDQGREDGGGRSRTQPPEARAPLVTRAMSNGERGALRIERPGGVA